jgi:hypothetical protein
VRLLYHASLIRVRFLVIFSPATSFDYLAFAMMNSFYSFEEDTASIRSYELASFIQKLQTD